MLRHVDKTCQMPPVILHRTINGNAELLLTPIAVEQGPSLVAGEGELVNLTPFVEVSDSFTVRWSFRHSRIVQAQTVVRTAGRANSGTRAEVEAR